MPMIHEEQRFTVQFCEPHTMTKLMQDTFTYHPNGCIPWLQRVCFWVLRKLGAHALDTFETWERRVDRQEFAEELFKRIQIVKQFREIKHVYIGAKDFDEWTRQVGNSVKHSIASPFEFNIEVWRQMQATGRVRTYSHDGTATKYSVPVEVLPWMEGVLVV